MQPDDEDPWVGLRDLLSAQPPRTEDVKPITAETIHKAVDALMNAPYRACPHLIPPGVEVIYDTESLDGTEQAIPCAAMCGEVLIVRRMKTAAVFESESQRPLAEVLLDVERDLRYRRIPVEGRLDAAAFQKLRVKFAPDPTMPVQPPTPLDLLSGIRLIVDPTMPPNRIRFLDGDGFVTHEIDL